ncbi:MAG: DUF2628 domain-containing protein [Ahrensia sp.]|nr:DUF2628 domain-containing protein [Ahrensia sp.]
MRPELKGEAREQNAVAIPEATAKWALIFPPFWLIKHGLMLELLGYGLITLVVLIVLFTPLAPTALFLGGLPALYLFLEGHQLRRDALERRGYLMVDVVDALDEEVALMKHFDAHDASQEDRSIKISTPLRRAPSLRGNDDLSFGLMGDPER